MENPLAPPGAHKTVGHVLEELDDSLEHGPPPGVRNGTLLVGEPIAEEDEDGDLEVAGDALPKTERSESVSSGGGRSHHLKKLKRTNRDRAYSTSEDGRFGGHQVTAAVAGHRHAVGVGKNSRKSRNGLGRGLPKKGGAGGKGTWGKPGCELELPWVDPNDPNYDSEGEEQKEAEMPVASGGVQPHGTRKTSLKPMVPEMSEEDVVKAVEPLILEYFENNDAMEVLFSLQDMLMNLGNRRYMVVTITIELAMDHKPSHREMSSVLISELYLKVISQRDIGKAFDHLLRQLPDLVLDTPDAADILGNFLARAIADDCIPPKFLHSYKGHADNEEAKAALRKADTLLSMKHGMVRLDNVWGVGGGVRPVKYLIKKIVLLLKEYLCSGDVKEATRCLTELEVPHFHHELVYEAVVMVIEAMHEKTEEAMCKLLMSLFRSFIITIDQMKNGFTRVYDFMPDIAIDVPAAYVVLERFVLRCRKEGLITDELARKMPTRGRKRFVSEGDGGRIKADLKW